MWCGSGGLIEIFLIIFNQLNQQFHIPKNTSLVGVESIFSSGSLDFSLGWLLSPMCILTKVTLDYIQLDSNRMQNVIFECIS